MGFSQRQVAEILGHLTATDISRYEHGGQRPGLVSALKFEIVYRVPVAFLFPELYRRLKEPLLAREERLRAKWNGPSRRTPA